MRRSGYVCLLLSSRPDAAYLRGAASIIRFVAGTNPPGFTLPSSHQQITVTINP